MTPWQYWTRWALVGAIYLLLARWFLVQPIVDACRPTWTPISILWHPVAPLTDWTPHASTAVR